MQKTSGITLAVVTKTKKIINSQKTLIFWMSVYSVTPVYTMPSLGVVNYNVTKLSASADGPPVGHVMSGRRYCYWLHPVLPFTSYPFL